MSLLNTDIQAQYEEAIESLKEINNRLFYNELKTKLDSRDENIETLTEEVNDAIESIEDTISSLADNVNDHLNEHLVQKVSTVFNEELGKLKGINSQIENELIVWIEKVNFLRDQCANVLTEVKDTQKHDHQWIYSQIINLQKEVTKEINKTREIVVRLLQETQQLQQQRNVELKIEVDRLKEKEVEWKAEWVRHLELSKVNQQSTKRFLLTIIAGQGALIILVIILVFL